MLTKCAVNIQITAVASFRVNCKGEKCDLTGLVRLEGGAGLMRDNKEIAGKI